MLSGDEHDEMRKLTGRVASIHKTLVSQSQCAKARQRTYLDDKGGWMFSKDSEAGKKVSKILEKEAKREKHGMLPIYEEKGVYNFYLKMGKGGSIAPLEELASASQGSPVFDARIVMKTIENDAVLQREVAELIAKRSSGGPRPRKV